jgi:hypothetical protein
VETRLETPSGGRFGEKSDAKLPPEGDLGGDPPCISLRREFSGGNET